MLVVVFGAGASYDSSPDRRLQTGVVANPGETFRPPLANGLFDNRDLFAEVLRDLPGSLRLDVTDLRQRGSSSVEQVLQTWQDDAETIPLRHRQLAEARYYLREVLKRSTDHWYNKILKGVTNYGRLLGTIEACTAPTETVCFVTFNYDTMLDQELSILGVHFKAMGDYIAHPKYKLIKLHGSVNWGRVITGAQDITVPVGVDPHTLTRAVISGAGQWEYGWHEFLGGEHMVSSHNMPAGTYRALFPAIAIPVEQKSTFECPEDHLTCLRTCLGRMTKLLVIGWRGREEHFLKLARECLQRPSPQGWIVAGSQDQAVEVASHLGRAMGQPFLRQVSRSPSTFTEFLDDKEPLRTFLRPVPS